MSLTTSIRRFVRQRRLYPPNRRDKVSFWLGMLVLLDLLFLRLFYSDLMLSLSSKSWLFNWWTLAAVTSLMFLTTYITQTPLKDEFKGYTTAITDIESISRQLSALVEFLKQERQRVAEAEATFLKLQSEKTELEPVVLAHRQTVDAILSAHSKTTASRAWKERVLGFISGLIASLVAAMVLALLRQ